MSLPTPIDGWWPTGTDPDVFGAVTITDAAVVDQSIIAVGCPSESGSGFPAWVSDDGVSWERAVGPMKIGDYPVGCLTELIVSRFGLFAHGLTLLHSSDGRVWEPVGFLTDEGHSIGYVDALFPTRERLTVLVRRGAEAESTIARLFTTDDGATWEEVPARSADLFDSAAVGAVLAADDGLIAVGAAPWGEFVPTAAVWTSPDGLEWRLVTPQGDGFTDAYMHAIVETDNGYVALGGSPFGTNLMAAWMSTNRTDWSRLPSPTGDTAAEHGFMEVYTITAIDTGFYAAGLDYDAGRSAEELPALWASADGLTWERHHVAPTGGLVPFTIVDFEDHSIGFWPPPFWPIEEPVQVFTDESDASGSTPDWPHGTVTCAEIEGNFPVGADDLGLYLDQGLASFFRDSGTDPVEEVFIQFVDDPTCTTDSEAWVFMISHLLDPESLNRSGHLCGFFSIVQEADPPPANLDTVLDQLADAARLCS